MRTLSAAGLLFVASIGCRSKPASLAPVGAGEVHLPVPLRLAQPDAYPVLLAAAREGTAGVAAPVWIRVQFNETTARDMVGRLSEGLGYGQVNSLGCAGCSSGSANASLTVSDGFIAGDSAWVRLCCPSAAVWGAVGA